MVNNSDDKLDDAILAFTLGETQEALNVLNKLSKENAASIDVWRALAEVCLSYGDLDMAEDACNKALGLKPDDLTSTVSLARILVKKGDKEGAEAASAKARVLGWKEELAEENE